MDIPAAKSVTVKIDAATKANKPTKQMPNFSHTFKTLALPVYFRYLVRCSRFTSLSVCLLVCLKTICTVLETITIRLMQSNGKNEKQ